MLIVVAAGDGMDRLCLASSSRRLQIYIQGGCMAVAAGAVMPAQCAGTNEQDARGQCALANGGRRSAKDQVHALRCCHIQLVW